MRARVTPESAPRCSRNARPRHSGIRAQVPPEPAPRWLQNTQHWPRHRYLELAPKHWAVTRARLRPEELAAPISAFEIPAELAPPSDDVRPAAE